MKVEMWVDGPFSWGPDARAVVDDGVEYRRTGGTGWPSECGNQPIRLGMALSRLADAMVAWSKEYAVFEDVEL